VSIETKTLGKTGLSLSILGFGGTGVGNIYQAVSESDAIDTVDRAYSVGLRYFDTAPLYGHGLSELRVGSGLRRFQDSSIVVSTKVGWRLRAAYGGATGAGIYADIQSFSRALDYSYDGVMQSLEDSMQRLGTDLVDILYLHDCDRHNQGADYPARFSEAMNGAYRAMVELRSQGVVKAIGCGLNEWQACQEFAEAGDFDCFLLAGRYTLLEQEALDSFLPLCEERNIGVVVGGPYNSGILANGTAKRAMFNYEPASDAIIRRVAAIEAVCRRHQVPIKAAALQFPLLHPCVASVIPGSRSTREIEENLSMVRTRIPADLWAVLKDEGLLDSRAPTG